jgi:hypothetical protein
MKPSHYRTPRQLGEATFYSSQTSEPAGTRGHSDLGEFLVTLVASVTLVAVLALVALGVL